MRARKLAPQRRPQGAGRDDPAITDAASGVNDEQRKVLGKGRILKAVVHDDDARRTGDRHPRALDAIARDDRRRHACEQKRLVAHVERAMPPWIDPHRTRKPPAISAAQEYRPFARMREHPRHRQCGWRLAAAANRQIPRADHRHAGAPATPCETQPGNRAIDHRHRCQHRRSKARFVPPE